MNKKIKKITHSKLPEQSILNLDSSNFHFIDSFQGIIDDPQNEITSLMVGKAFFTSSPKWVEKLFAFRNKIVSLFGLKTSGKAVNRKELLDNFKCETGEQLGLFKVFGKNEQEVVLGEDDKHLNFRISLFLSPDKNDWNKKTLTISTTVVFNNRFGRLYFLPVKPFHKRIVPLMLKGIIKQLKK
ncbi:MAG: DUF2867 domain-containing protein [Flavobacteriia bacterium]|nr:DUF2867 domain-containing protein [Flavobacteriia bacterium]